MRSRRPAVRPAPELRRLGLGLGLRRLRTVLLRTVPPGMARPETVRPGPQPVRPVGRRRQAAAVRTPVPRLPQAAPRPDGPVPEPAAWPTPERRPGGAGRAMLAMHWRPGRGRPGRWRPGGRWRRGRPGRRSRRAGRRGRGAAAADQARLRRSGPVGVVRGRRTVGLDPWRSLLGRGRLLGRLFSRGGLFRLHRPAQPLGVRLPADPVGLGILDGGRVALDADAQREAQIQCLLVGQPELTAQFVDADLLRQLVPQCPFRAPSGTRGPLFSHIRGRQPSSAGRVGSQRPPEAVDRSGRRCGPEGPGERTALFRPGQAVRRPAQPGTASGKAPPHRQRPVGP